VGCPGRCLARRAQPDPAQAVATWLGDFDKGPAHFPGLRDRMAGVFADETSEIARACRPMKEAFGRLLERAQQARVVRDPRNRRGRTEPGTRPQAEPSTRSTSTSSATRSGLGLGA